MNIEQFIKKQIQDETHTDRLEILSLEKRLLAVAAKEKHSDRVHKSNATPAYVLRFAATAIVALILLFVGVSYLPHSTNPLLNKVATTVGVKKVSAAELIKAVQEAINTARLHYVEVGIDENGNEHDGIEIWVDRNERKVRRVMPKKEGFGQYVDIGYLWGSDNPRSYVFLADEKTKEGLFIESLGIPAIEILIEKDFQDAIQSGFMENAAVDIVSYEGNDVYKLTLKSPEGKIWRVVYIDPKTHLPVASEGYLDSGELGGKSKFIYKQDNFTDEIFSVNTAPLGYSIMQNPKVTQFSLYPTAMDIPNDGTAKRLRYGYQIVIANQSSSLTNTDGFLPGFTPKFSVSTATYGSIEEAKNATDVIYEPLKYDKPTYLLPQELTFEEGTGRYALFKLSIVNEEGNVAHELERVVELTQLTNEEKFTSGPLNMPEYFTIFGTAK